MIVRVHPPLLDYRVWARARGGRPGGDLTRAPFRVAGRPPQKLGEIFGHGTVPRLTMPNLHDQVEIGRIASSTIARTAELSAQIPAHRTGLSALKHMCSSYK
jgi:hypothetical protein